MTRSSRISPTAHYTGYVWVRNGLSDPAFATTEGQLFYHSLNPATRILRRTGNPTVEGFLIARHRMIDHLLTSAIDDGRVSQVIEIAAGLSARGWRFSRSYGDRLTYIEADLPGMAERKRKLLANAPSTGPSHEVVDIDALRDSGPGSIAELTATLDPARGLAIITEGLVNYFDRDTVTALWRRLARAMDPFSTGLYLSDLMLERSTPRLVASIGRTLLSAFVRGQVHQHFATADDVEAALRKAGFAAADVHNPADHAAALDLSDVRSARAASVIEAAT